MPASEVYTNKAKAYARYRWDYAPEALQTILEISGLGADAVAADLGAGTGIFTRQLARAAAQVIAVEPNVEMRHEAAVQLAEYPQARILAASGEHTTIDSHSVDLVSVAQAIHWFQPEPARSEILRILKPGGWLALLRNATTGEDDISQAVSAISTAAYGAQEVHAAPAVRTAPGFYYGHEKYQRWIFPFQVEQTWERFIGSLCSASYLPDPSHALFPRFEQAAREIFERFSQNGKRVVCCVTELLLGQPV